MKYLITAVLLAIMQAAPPIPGKTPNGTTDTGHAVNSQSYENSNPSWQSQALANENATVKDDSSGHKPTSENTKQTIRVGELPAVSVSRDWADWVSWGFNGLLVLVGALTLGAIWYQAREMKRATKAMQDSIQLQEAELRQWVEVINWGTDDEKQGEPLAFGSSGDKVFGAPDTLPILIMFDVANKTPKPLTITGIRTEIWVQDRTEWEKFTGDEKATITPNGTHPSNVRIVLRDQEVKKYLLDDLRISISVAVLYEDVLGRPNQQPFTEILVAGIHENRVMRYAGKTQTGKDEQKAN